MMDVDELNQAIASGEIVDLVQVTEAKQRKALSRIADDICAKAGVRLVLLAGGSAAGKTTTAKRLVTQIKVNDRYAMLLSTDDYFVGDDATPRDENGELDYEHVDCVDVSSLVADLSSLFRGEKIRERRFDFVAKSPVYTDRFLSLPENGFVVLEGIHALNPKLTGEIDEERKYRVFVEPKPSLAVFGGFPPSPREARFLRRMVRDNQFRKIPPAQTVRSWPKVLAGEEKWIEPFRAEADATFDSYLVYELAVLKLYVGGLLARVEKEFADNREVAKMIALLSLVDEASPNLVPGDSILRETIGGSQIVY